MENPEEQTWDDDGQAGEDAATAERRAEEGGEPVAFNGGGGVERDVGQDDTDDAPVDDAELLRLLQEIEELEGQAQRLTDGFGVDGTQSQ